MNRKDHNQYVTHDDYVECLVYNLKDEYVGSFLIDKDDIEKCKKHMWSFYKSSNGKYVRVVTYINNKHISLHKYLLDYWGNLQIDHINRNTLDNRKCNLRIVTSCENNSNKGKEYIYAQKNGKYKCIFRRYGKNYHVGYFDTIEKAIIARDKKLKEIEDNDKLLKEEYFNLRNQAGKWITPTPSGKWRSFYQKGKKLISLGVFDTIKDAEDARKNFMASLEKKLT